MGIERERKWVPRKYDLNIITGMSSGHIYIIRIYIYNSVHMCNLGICINIWLVVWYIWIFCPFHIWDVILPIDELIFFKMVKTTNQMRIIDYIAIKPHESQSSPSKPH
jgi:hypothetical protein